MWQKVDWFFQSHESVQSAICLPGLTDTFVNEL